MMVLCDILKCGVEFCEGERVMAGREVGVYKSIKQKRE
jgi:hypothetical protein